jgi:hypothetical protein
MARQRRRPSRPRAEPLESREVPAVSLNESFDAVNPGQLPPGWAQWDSTPAASFTVSAGQSLSSPNSLLGSSTTSAAGARAWFATALPADVQVGAAVYLNSLIPAQVLARGTGLDTTSPSYYALAVTRGLQLQLLRVQNGTTTVLGQVNSATYLSSVWVRLTLFVNGSNVRGQVFRSDKAQYLTPSGQWQSAATWAINLTDTGITGAGDAGVARPASYTGGVSFDDFSVTDATGNNVPPSVTLTAPAAGATLTGIVPVQATAMDSVGVTKVEFYLDNVLRAVSLTAPYVWNFDSSSASNGTHTLSAWAYDAAGNIGRTSISVTTQNDTALPRPTIPQHYPHIRIAELAYTGTPLDATALQLLQNSVDLVVPAASLLSAIHALAPNTPQLIYSNFSNLAQDVLLDWLAFADAHGYSRESAFYHVSAATPFSGNSPSSQPVTWFWAAYRGSGSSWTYQTSQARGTAAGGLSFAAPGQAVALGALERFREINVNLSKVAAGGWSAVLEYPTAVDANGNPTAWGTLTPLADGTAGLTQSGRIAFDPPPDWVPASISGSARLYYVRFRTTTGGTIPVAATVLGRDYVNANGGTSGTIPAFDYAADTDHDGYLNDAEYANRAPGKDARFAYESRLFAPGYGQMRFAANPSNLATRAWATDYALRVLQGAPLAGGLFVDNSGANAPAGTGVVLEPTASFGTDYGALLNAVGQAIAPRWLLANTTGTGTLADPVVQSVQASFEEFALRPLSGNYQQFEDLASLVVHQEALTSPPPYLVLDSLPAGGTPADPRTQLTTLAEYYLLADPHNTFLDFYGGSAPATSWAQHWSPAVTYDVGQPAGTWSVAATGADPANAALTYKVYQRQYTNALMLYKPLSYATGGTTGTTADATATTIDLGGTYYPVQADGTLGAGVTSVSLRNGEGVVLAKSSPAVPSQFVVGGLPASTTAGQTTTVTVTGEDSAGNVSTAYAGTVHFTSSDVQAGLPGDYTFTAADHGAHTFTIAWKTAGPQTLTVVDTASTTTSGSAGLTVIPGASTRLTASAGTFTAGTATAITVTAVDAYGNRATVYAGTVHFTSSDGSATLPGDYTFAAADQGTHTFAVVLDAAGPQTLTIADTSAGGPAGTLSVTVTPAAASHFRLAAPPAAVAGSTFDVTVTALDPFNNVAAGYTGTVAVTSSDAQAVLPAAYTFTAADAGSHTFAGLTALATAGSQTLTVADTASGSTQGTSTVQVSPGAAVALRMAVPAAATAGSAFDVTVRAVDAYGNTATGYAGTVSFTATDPTAVLPGGYTFAPADAGVHTFAAAAVLDTAGTQTITVRDGGSLQAAGTVTVNPAAPAALVLSGLGATATAGQSAAVTVTAEDAFGNVATGYAGTVTFTSGDGQAGLPASYLFTTTDQGRHTFAVTWKTAGTQTLTVADTATASLTAQASVQVSPAAADRLIVTAPTDSTAGASCSLTVSALDRFGNLATGYSGTVDLGSGDGQAVLPADYTFAAADGGTHTFTVSLRTAGMQAVTATDTGNGVRAAGTTVTVLPGAASTLLFTGLPAQATAGTAQDFTLTAVDAFGNVATGYAGTVHFTSSDGQAIPQADYAFTSADAGVHTFSITLKTAGSQTVTATDTVAGSQTAGASITVSPAGASVFQLSGPGGPLTAGTPGSVSLTVLDAYGNAAASYTGTVHFASTDPTAALPADYAFVAADAGRHTFTVTWTTAGSWGLTVTDAATTSLAATVAGITVQAAAPDHLAFAGQPGAAVAGQALSPAVTVAVEDRFGNVVTADSTDAVTVALAGGPAGAALAGTTTATVQNGLATFRNLVLVQPGTGYRLSAGGTGLTGAGSTAFAVTAAPATHLAVSTVAGSTAGMPFTVTLTALDPYGNTDTHYTGTVHFSSSDAAATLPADYTFTAGDAGTHTFTNGVTLRTTGSQTLQASAPAVAGTAAVSVTPAGAARFTLGFSSGCTAGSGCSVTVTAVDAAGNLVPAYTGTVRLTSGDGQAVLPAAYTFTAADHGVHTFTVTLKTAGSQTVTANDRGAGISGTAAVTVSSGTLRSFGVQLSAASASAGNAVTATVTARDAYGNVVTGYAGTARFTSGDRQASLPASYTFTAGDAGSHTFTVTFRTVGSQALTVADSVFTGFLGSAALTVSPAGVDHLGLTGPAGTTAGTAASVTVTALDAFNNVVTGYAGTVHFTSSDASASLPADYTFQAGDNGTHTFAAVTLRTAGTQTIAAAGTVAGTLSVGVNPAAVAKLRPVVPPGITAGNAFNLTVQAVDAFGNLVPGYLGTVRLTSGDAQALLPAAYTFTAADRGSHVFRVTLKTAGSQAVTATDTANLSGSVAVPTSPGPLRGFSVQPASASTTAGQGLMVTVIARDGFGNVVTGYTGTVRFSSSDRLASLPANYTFTAADAGVHAFAFPFRTAGTQTLTVVDAVSTGFLGSASVAVVPAAASVLVVSGFPSSTSAGTAGSFTVTARDAYGNLATGYTGTVRFTSSDTQAVLPASYKFQATDRGSHIFSAVFKTTGTQKITATDTLTASVTGSQVGIVVVRLAWS